jgi:hypothetical protein
MSLFKVFQLQERGMWLCKKKSIRKNRQMSEISKTMGTQMPTMKKRRRKKERNEKDSPCSLAKMFSMFQTRDI